VKNDRATFNSKSDIIIWGKEEGTCVLIDTAFSGDRNMIKEEAEKISEYKSRNTPNVKYKN
jgi:hypothetical protein